MILWLQSTKKLALTGRYNGVPVDLRIEDDRLQVRGQSAADDEKFLDSVDIMIGGSWV